MHYIAVIERCVARQNLCAKRRALYAAKEPFEDGAVHGPVLPFALGESLCLFQLLGRISGVRMEQSIDCFDHQVRRFVTIGIVGQPVPAHIK